MRHGTCITIVLGCLGLASIPALAAQKGFGISPDNPRYFAYNGKPFYLIGSGMESQCQAWSDTRPKWYAYLDMLHRNGFNRVRFFLWDIAWQTELKPHFSPWRVLDARNADFDLTQFNPEYWGFVRDILRYAEKPGIVFEYDLFDYCSLAGAEWAKHPFAANNNNGGAVPGDSGRPALYAFADYADLDLFKQPLDKSWPWQKRNQWCQQLYVKRTIDELSAFPNLYWEIMNEQGYGRVEDNGPEWTAHWLRFLDKYDAHRHLRSINAADVFDEMPGMDIVCEHPIPFFNHGWKGPEDAVPLIRANLRFGKPVVCDETGFYPPPKSTDDPVWRAVTPEQMVNERKAFWYAFVAGGQWTAVCWQDFQEQDRRRWVKHLADFVEQVPYWRMDPHDDLVQGGHCLAQPGREYVVYLSNGGKTTVDLSAIPAGKGRAAWIDPRTGDRAPVQRKLGAAREEFSAPTDDDWALWIEAQL